MMVLLLIYAIYTSLSRQRLRKADAKIKIFWKCTNTYLCYIYGNIIKVNNISCFDNLFQVNGKFTYFYGSNKTYRSFS